MFPQKRSAIVSKILPEWYPYKLNPVTQKLRTSLYRIAQLADPASKIDHDPWAHGGIIEVAECDCELGFQPHSFSGFGRV